MRSREGTQLLNEQGYDQGEQGHAAGARHLIYPSHLGVLQDTIKRTQHKRPGLSGHTKRLRLTSIPAVAPQMKYSP